MAEKYFITGATGLIGGALARHLVSNGGDVTIFVRNQEKAKEIFSDVKNISIVEGTLEDRIIYEGDIDYIIHAAAPTDSTFFIEHPVETIDSIVLGTKSVLELAKSKSVKSILNLSSMEVYGAPTNGEDLTEERQFYLDPLNIRSNYPMAKRLSETMCASYASEYGVPVKTARLAQVLGRKLLPDDNRVIAQFIRSAKERTDIVLATDGSTKQTYIAIDDAIDGLLTILYKGENGRSYNVANDETYCSIRDVAEIVARDIAQGKISVTINMAANGGKYPPTRTLRINSTKLKGLGWSPTIGLSEALGVLANSKEEI